MTGRGFFRFIGFFCVPSRFTPEPCNYRVEGWGERCNGEDEARED